MDKFLKWCFFGYVLAVFGAIWPNVEQPKVQLLVFQIGGMILWIVSSLYKPLRQSPKEHLVFFTTLLLFAICQKNQIGFFYLTNAFIASLVYFTVSEKIEKDWILYALFWASFIQIPVAIGQIFGYDPIFNYTLASTTNVLAHQGTGFIGTRSFLCIFFATVSMLFLTVNRNSVLLYGLCLSILASALRGIAGMGGIIASWMLWAAKKNKYIFLMVCLVSLCVIIPQARYIWDSKSTVRLIVWRPFLDASFATVYTGHGLGSTKAYLPVLMTNGWGTAWSDIKNSYLTIFFEMGIAGLFLVGYLFKKVIKLYKETYIPVVFYAFTVLAFSSLFQTTHVYPSIGFLWILIFSLIYIELGESIGRKEQ